MTLNHRMIAKQVNKARPHLEPIKCLALRHAQTAHLQDRNQHLQSGFSMLGYHFQWITNQS